MRHGLPQFVLNNQVICTLDIYDQNQNTDNAADDLCC